MLPHEPLVRRADVRLEVRREGLPLHGLAQLAADVGQGAGVLDVERGQHPVDAVGEALVLEEPAVGVGGGREAVGHPDAGCREVLDHLAERRVLASDRVDVGETEVGEPGDVGGAAGHGCSFRRAAPLPRCVRG